MDENVSLDRLNVSVSRRQVMIGEAGLSFAVALNSY